MARRTISYADDLDEWVQAQIAADTFDGYSDAFRTAMRALRQEYEDDHTDSQRGAGDEESPADGPDRTGTDSGVDRLAEEVAELEARLDELADARLCERIADLEARLAALEQTGDGRVPAWRPGDEPVGGSADHHGDADSPPEAAPTTGMAAESERRGGATTTDGAAESPAHRGDVLSGEDLETIMAPTHWIDDPETAKAVTRRHEAVVGALEWLRDEADEGSARRGEFLTAIDGAYAGIRRNRDTYWDRTLQPALEHAVDIGLVDYDSTQQVYRWQGID